MNKKRSILKPVKIKKQRAVSLVEIMMTLAIVSIASLATISGLIYVIRVEADLKQRNGAFRQATTILERTKKTLFDSLAPAQFQVPIDTRGTVQTADDIQGTARLQFFDMDGTLLNTLPKDRSMVRARVTVSWRPAGRKNATQSVVAESLLVP